MQCYYVSSRFPRVVPLGQPLDSSPVQVEARSTETDPSHKGSLAVVTSTVTQPAKRSEEWGMLLNKEFTEM